MTKLTDTQMILLSTASQRDNGSLYPLPSTLRPNGGTTKSIAALVSIGLAEERETASHAEVARTDGDLGYGTYITPAGLRAIGVDDAVEPQPAGLASDDVAVAAPATKPERFNKSAAVLALLQRDTGATMPELIEVTGWLPHTTRAALTGLRKKGHAVERSKRADVTCYRVIVA